jgi:hypothetical protein
MRPVASSVAAVRVVVWVLWAAYTTPAETMRYSLGVFPDRAACERAREAQGPTQTAQASASWGPNLACISETRRPLAIP